MDNFDLANYEENSTSDFEPDYFESPPQDLLSMLNPSQQEAVTMIEGPVLALAGPGSGKTRALTHRIAYLVQQCKIPPWNILAVTFTNKAAKEMKNRLATMLSDRQVYSLSVGTFHSLCARWLRRDIETLGHYDANFVIYDTADQESLMKRAIRDLNLDDKRWKPSAVLHVISNAKNEMITVDKFQPRNYQEEVMGRLYERYQGLLIENNALDFDDLLLITHRLLKQNKEILERYQQNFIHVMVDEFQDTNMVQYDLARMLAGGHGNLFVVGDPDQGIYSWRGADYRNVFNFRKDYPAHRLINLSQNYRSTEVILSAAKQIIRKNRNRIDNDLFTQRGTGTKIEVKEAYNDEEEAKFVVSEIRRLTTHEQFSLGEVAVMYRTNAQSRVLEESFIAHNMPYILVRGTRFYDRKEVKDMLAYLRLIHNPEDSLSLRRIINVPARAIGEKTISDLENLAFQSHLTPWQAMQKLSADGTGSPFTSRSHKALVGFADLMRLLVAAKANFSLTELFDMVTARTSYQSFIKDGTEEGESRWENVLELRRATIELGELPASETLSQFLENVALVADVDALKEGTAAPALLTLHAAKGLEFRVVFMVGMEEGICPHSRSMADAEQMEEERRLAYVGVTRAEDRLYFTHALRRRGYSGFEETATPSRFLGDISPDLLQEDGRRKPAKNQSTATPAPAKPATPNPARWNQPAVTPPPVKPAPPNPARWNQPAEKPLPSPLKTDSYKVGETVFHRKYGQGTIIAVEQAKDDVYLQVAFPSNGIKKLAASIAPLERR